MDTRCQAWNIKDDIMGTFIGGPKYYLPYRCHETKLAGEDICAKCLKKKDLPRNNKNHPARWWGLVTEPIGDLGSQISHLAFSPWFVEWAKKKPLPPESMARAKKAIDRAREGIPDTPPLPHVVTSPPTDTKVEEMVAPLQEPAIKKKPRIVKPKEAVPEEAKPRKPRVKKTVSLAATVAVEIQAVLSDEPPLEADDVLEVQVKPFEHNGTLYYMDSTKSKLYDRQKDGGCKGIYMGRWDSAVERIVKDDDSDREC
jgi:hypothetical protein